MCISRYPLEDIANWACNDLSFAFVGIATALEPEFNPLVPFRSTEDRMSNTVKKPGGGTRIKTSKEHVRDFDKRANAIAAGHMKPGQQTKKK